MADFGYSDWAEEANWVQCHNAEVNKDTSVAVAAASAAASASASAPRPTQTHDVSTSFHQYYGFPSWSIPVKGVAEEDRAAASSSKSHSQAEKRRRDRINSQLATLRKLIPKSDKMDKAALLGSVIDNVKDLKRKAMEISQMYTIPTEMDEVNVECGCCDLDVGSSSSSSSSSSNNKSKENIFIKVSVCCDDRPELFKELIKAIKGLRLTTVKADMASLGGRIKSILVLCSSSKDGDEDGGSSASYVSNLKQSLRVVLSRIASSSAAAQPNYRIASKRQRFFFPSNYSQ